MESLITRQPSGRLEGMPIAIVERMMRILRSIFGNEYSKEGLLTLLETNLLTCFTWEQTAEGDPFWRTILAHKDYDHFFMKYPKEPRTISLQDYKYYKNYRGSTTTAIKEPVQEKFDEPKYGILSEDWAPYRKGQIIKLLGKVYDAEENYLLPNNNTIPIRFIHWHGPTVRHLLLRSSGSFNSVQFSRRDVRMLLVDYWQGQYLFPKGSLFLGTHIKPDFDEYVILFAPNQILEKYDKYVINSTPLGRKGPPENWQGWFLQPDSSVTEDEELKSILGEEPKHTISGFDPYKGVGKGLLAYDSCTTKSELLSVKLEPVEEERQIRIPERKLLVKIN